MSGSNINFSAFDGKDSVTNLTEIVRPKMKTVEHVAGKCAHTLLSRYPWPARCIRDKEGEDTRRALQKSLGKCNIKDTPTNTFSRNPKANDFFM